ncbi:MAG: type IV pilus assembly protein PilM [Magnetococcales bacterium]|nr:type IV pilus assembly protein PilM [Magnetococcales bacterium]
MFPFGSRFRPIVGVDIGTSAVKAVELRPAGKKWRLHHCSMQPLPADAIVDGQIKEPEAVAEAIRILIKEGKFSTKNAAIAVSGASVVIKKIQTPFMSELELEDQIALEAEEYIPFGIDEVYLDFQILGTTTASEDEKNLEIILTACKKDAVEVRQELLRQVGLTPLLCDVDLFALSNAYGSLLAPATSSGSDNGNIKGKSKGRTGKISKGGEKGKEKDSPKGPPTTGGKSGGETTAVCLVNTGATHLNIDIIVEGNPVFTRDVAFGGNTLTRPLEQEYKNLTPQQMGAILTEGAFIADGVRQEVPQFREEVIQPFFEQLVRQASQTVDFFNNTNPNTKIGMIHLSGGCALLGGLEKRMEEMLSIPSRLADPFASLSPEKKTLGAGVRPQDSPRFMIALGLALRGGAL